MFQVCIRFEWFGGEVGLKKKTMLLQKWLLEKPWPTYHHVQVSFASLDQEDAAKTNRLIAVPLSESFAHATDKVVIACAVVRSDFDDLKRSVIEPARRLEGKLSILLECLVSHPSLGNSPSMQNWRFSRMEPKRRSRSCQSRQDEFRFAAD